MFMTEGNVRTRQHRSAHPLAVRSRYMYEPLAFIFFAKATIYKISLIALDGTITPTTGKGSAKIARSVWR